MKNENIKDEICSIQLTRVGDSLLEILSMDLVHDTVLNLNYHPALISYPVRVISSTIRDLLEA